MINISLWFRACAYGAIYEVSTGHPIIPMAFSFTGRVLSHFPKNQKKCKLKNEGCRIVIMVYMDDSNKFKVLTAIYSFYDQFLKGFPLACRPGCHVCCTVNIVATSLEAGHLLHSSFFDNLDLKKLLSSATTGSVYRPSLSTNQIADLCLRQEEIPPDRVEHGEGVCPFLDQEGLCSVYENRPFACRAMSSREVCQYGGEADMEPFLVTVNLAVYQIIEHLDKKGASGNLLDVLSELVNNQFESPGMVNGLISNRALPGFLVTPDEQGRFGAFMHRLADFQVGDTTMGAFLPGLFAV